MRQQIMRFGPLMILLGLVAAAYATNLSDYISLEQVKTHKDAMRTFVVQNRIAAPVLFTLVYAGCVALSLPIATLLTLLGGFLFGLWAGTAYVVMGATVGATIIFLVAKTSLGSTLRDKAGPLYTKIETNMKENAVGYLLFMRLVPLFPFVAVNVVPALFNIPVRTFVWTTLFGILPGSAVYVYFGQQLGAINSLSDLASPKTLLAFALLGLFALLPTFIKHIKARQNKAVTP